MDDLLASGDASVAAGDNGAGAPSCRGSTQHRGGDRTSHARTTAAPTPQRLLSARSCLLTPRITRALPKRAGVGAVVGTGMQCGSEMGRAVPGPYELLAEMYSSPGASGLSARVSAERRLQPPAYAQGLGRWWG